MAQAEESTAVQEEGDGAAEVNGNSDRHTTSHTVPMDVCERAISSSTPDEERLRHACFTPLHKRFYKPAFGCTLNSHDMPCYFRGIVRLAGCLQLHLVTAM